MTVGPNKGIELDGTFFTTGDQIVFSYDQHDSTLQANGQPWHSWKSWQRERPAIPLEAWADELSRRFKADRAGTDLSRLQRAYDSMDKTPLDTTFTRIEPSRLTIKFRGGSEPIGILLLDSPGPHEPQPDPDDQAKAMVMHLSREMSSPTASFRIKFPFGEAWFGGDRALESITLCRTAIVRDLTTGELKRCKELQIASAVERIRSRSRTPAGTKDD